MCFTICRCQAFAGAFHFSRGSAALCMDATLLSGAPNARHAPCDWTGVFMACSSTKPDVIALHKLLEHALVSEASPDPALGEALTLSAEARGTNRSRPRPCLAGIQEVTADAVHAVFLGRRQSSTLGAGCTRTNSRTCSSSAGIALSCGQQTGSAERTLAPCTACCTQHRPKTL